VLTRPLEQASCIYSGKIRLPARTTIDGRAAAKVGPTAELFGAASTRLSTRVAGRGLGPGRTAGNNVYAAGCAVGRFCADFRRPPFHGPASVIGLVRLLLMAHGI